MPVQEARLSLEGLSVGDAFGEQFFGNFAEQRIRERELAEYEWRWTDDTHMALSVYETLLYNQRIDQDALIERFARRYHEDPWRGYGGGARKLLEHVFWGEDWRKASRSLFSGGSYGNGSAMRAAPIGGYFAGDLERAAEEGRLAAEVTHMHPEGIAGGMAVAAAAAAAALGPALAGNAFLETVLDYVPEGLTRAGIIQAMALPVDTPSIEAARVLGSGQEVSAQDTVPFCLWCAAHHLDDYEEALWATAAGLGDMDTTCAIVGGIVVLSAKTIPNLWRTLREPLPHLP